jgi:hypothetical protein
VFKKTSERTSIGTPIEHLPFLTKHRVAELKARGVESVEGLATMADRLVKDCGPTTREEREQAKVWLDKAEQSAVVSEASAKNAELAGKLKALEDQIALLLARKEEPKSEPKYANDPDDPKTWDYDRLRDFAVENGLKVRSNMSRDKLLGAVMELSEPVEVVEELD